MTRTTALRRIGRLAGALLAIAGLLIGIAALSGVYADEGGTGDGGMSASTAAPTAPPTPGPFDSPEASFESVNQPGYFIGHRFSLGELMRIDGADAPDAPDVTFIVRSALTGTPGAVSFESWNYPGYFLRHQDFRLKLHRDDGSDLFQKDASFMARPGLAETPWVTARSFESENLPGHFIRHRDFHLWVERDDGSALFRSDATFLHLPGRYHPDGEQLRPTPRPAPTPPPTIPATPQGLRWLRLPAPATGAAYAMMRWMDTDNEDYYKVTVGCGSLRFSDIYPYAAKDEVTWSHSVYLYGGVDGLCSEVGDIVYELQACNSAGCSAPATLTRPPLR